MDIKYMTDLKVTSFDELKGWIHNTVEVELMGQPLTTISKKTDEIFLKLQQEIVPQLKAQLKSIEHSFKPFHFTFDLSQALLQFIEDEANQFLINEPESLAFEEEIRSLLKKLSVESSLLSLAELKDETDSQKSLRKVQTYISEHLEKIGIKPSTEIYDVWYKVLHHPILLEVSLAFFLEKIQEKKIKVYNPDLGKMETEIGNTIRIAFTHLEEGFRVVAHSLKRLDWLCGSFIEELTSFKSDGQLMTRRDLSHPVYAIKVIEDVRKVASLFRATFQVQDVPSILSIKNNFFTARKFMDALAGSLLEGGFERILCYRQGLIQILETHLEKRKTLLSQKDEKLPVYIGSDVYGVWSTQELQKILAFQKVLQHYHYLFDTLIYKSFVYLNKVILTIDAWKSHHRDYMSLVKSAHSLNQSTFVPLSQAEIDELCKSEDSSNQTRSKHRKKGPRNIKSQKTQSSSSSQIALPILETLERESEESSQSTISLSPLESGRNFIKKLEHCVRVAKNGKSKIALRQAIMHFQSVLNAYQFLSEKPSSEEFALIIMRTHHYIEQLLRFKLLDKNPSGNHWGHNLHAYRIALELENHPVINQVYLAGYWVEALHREYSVWKSLETAERPMPAFLQGLYQSVEESKTLTSNVKGFLEDVIALGDQLMKDQAEPSLEKISPQIKKDLLIFSSSIKKSMSRLKKTLEEITSFYSPISDIYLYLKQASWALRLLDFNNKTLEKEFSLEEFSFLMRENLYWQHLLMEHLFYAQNQLRASSISQGHHLSELYETSGIASINTKFLDFLRTHFVDTHNIVRYPFESRQHDEVLSSEFIAESPELLEGWNIVGGLRTNLNFIEVKQEALSLDHLKAFLLHTLENTLLFTLDFATQLNSSSGNLGMHFMEKAKTE